MSSGFQITIDKAVRRKLGIKPGDLAVERVEDGRLIVDFIPGSHRESLYGIFHRPDTEPITDWRAAKDRAWEMRSEEIMDLSWLDSHL